MKSVLAKCESPIETRLGEALQLVLHNEFGRAVKVIPQYQLGGFRYDFAIVFAGEMGKFYRRPVFLIECDGKEFHRTVAQLENDRLKDITAAQNNSPCLRYTGSAIFQNPYVIAAEVARSVSHMRRWAIEAGRLGCGHV